MTIVDGNKIAAEILEKLKKEIRGRGMKLRLAAVLVGNDPGLKKFVELKGKAAREIDAEFALLDFPETISEAQLKKEVREIVQDDANEGVLVELPLPKGINAQNVLNEIILEKDVDVLSQKAQDRFYGWGRQERAARNERRERGRKGASVVEAPSELVLPPAVEAVKTVLEFYHFDVKGKKAAVFGYGLLVGKPIVHWLSQSGAMVSIIDENTKNPERYSLEADLVISGVGKSELISGNMVKEGVVAIDFGYSNKDGRIVGDFKFDEVAARAGLITPVPGGMGPIVVVSVLKNLVRLNS